MALADISNLEDIQLLVNTFYSRIRENELLGPIFDERIGDRWPEHLEKMYRFWQTILLDQQTYYGAPFPPHAPLPVERLHFEAWLQTWNGTVDALFEGVIAEEAKWRGNRMASVFLSKITAMRSGSMRPLM